LGTDRTLARRNLLLAFLAQNFGLGMTYGSYGSLLHPIEVEFGLTRAVASSGMSVMLLVLGLLSPFVGKLLERISIRFMMVSGALLNGLANVVLAVAPETGILLLGYAVLGAGTCLLGIIAPTTLVSRWYASGRGRALGMVNLPLILPLAPLALAAFLPSFGLRGCFAAIAAINFFLTPIFFLVIDQPAHRKGEPQKSAASESCPEILPLKPVFMFPSFWLLTLGNGLLTAAGTVFVVHFLAFAALRGLRFEEAAQIFTGYGLSGLIGTLAFGWLADRIAPSRALCLNAALSACLWSLLLLVSGFASMFVIACLIGCCTTSLVALQGAVTSSVFGVRYVSSVMGVTYFFKLPFIFGAAPLIGFLFDRTGGYTSGFLIVIAGFLCATLSFALVRQFKPSL